MASRRVLVGLIQAVFDVLSDEDKSDNNGGNEIYALLGVPMVLRADLMAANFSGDKTSRRTTLSVLI